jgi:hypothetical protein
MNEPLEFDALAETETEALDFALVEFGIELPETGDRFIAADLETFDFE